MKQANIYILGPIYKIKSRDSIVTNVTKYCFIGFTRTKRDHHVVLINLNTGTYTYAKLENNRLQERYEYVDDKTYSINDLNAISHHIFKFPDAADLDPFVQIRNNKMSNKQIEY